MNANRVTSAEAARIRAMRYEDGMTIPAVAAVVRRAESTVRKHAPGRVGHVPVEPLRIAFEASPRTAGDVARSLGWWCKGGRCADTSRVNRMLGITPDVQGTSGRRSFRKVADAEMVGLAAEALGLAPWEVGA